MTDINLTDLLIIPASHLALQNIEQALILQKENKTLKRAIWLGFGAGIILLTIYKIKNEKREKN